MSPDPIILEIVDFCFLSDFRIKQVLLNLLPQIDTTQVGILVLAEGLHRACRPKGPAGSLADEIFPSTIVNFTGAFFICYHGKLYIICLLYTSPSPRDGATSRMPSSA